MPVYCFAQDKQEPITFDADRIEAIGAENKLIGEGNVVISYKGSTLTADKVIFYRLTKDVEAFGNVRIEQAGNTIFSDEARFNMDTQKGKMSGARISAAPFYAKADTIEKISDKEMWMYNGYFTTCDKDKPHYRLKTRRMDLSLGEKIVAKDLTFMLYDSPLTYMPYYMQPLNDNRPRVTVTPGMSKEWGYYVLSAWRYYFSEDFLGRVHLDYREKKDLATGFDTKYNTNLFGEGFLRTYYMNERNIELKKPWASAFSEMINKDLLKKEDVDVKSRNTTERERYRISLRHNWDVDDDTTIKAEYNRVSDADFLGDYYLREYEKSASTSSYFLFTHLMPFSTFSVLGQKRTNRFLSEVEKLPEAKLDIASVEIGESNFYYSGVTSIANLNAKTAAPSDVTNHANRVDNENKLSYPKKIAFIETSPFVTFRETYYDRDADSSSDDVFRGVFSTGIDMSTKFYRIFETHTNVFNLDINRLRHVITPSISYGYTHEPTVPSSKLYIFDGVDSISGSNSATLSLENKLQTKRGDKIVDLLRFLVDSPYIFHFEDHGSRFGNINLDLEATPYDWLRFESDAIYDKDDRAFKNAGFDFVLTGPKEKSFNTGKNDVSAEDEDTDYATFFGAGYRWQRNSSNQLTTQLTHRLNKDWKFKVYERWEEETGGLREQEYTIYKNLHCWQLELTYNVRRGYGEAIYLVFRIKAFPESGVEFNNSYHAPKMGSQSY